MTEEVDAGPSAPTGKALIFQTTGNSAKQVACTTHKAGLVRGRVQRHTYLLLASSLLQKLFCVFHHLDRPSSETAVLRRALYPC